METVDLVNKIEKLTNELISICDEIFNGHEEKGFIDVKRIREYDRKKGQLEVMFDILHGKF